MKEKKLHIMDVLKILELPSNSWKLDEGLPKHIAEQKLNEFKSLVKKQYRVLIKKYHPDLPKNGELEEEKMKEINGVIEVINKLKITRLKPKPRMRVRFYYTPNSNSTASTSNIWNQFFS